MRGRVWHGKEGVAWRLRVIKCKGEAIAKRGWVNRNCSGKLVVGSVVGLYIRRK